MDSAVGEGLGRTVRVGRRETLLQEGLLAAAALAAVLFSLAGWAPNLPPCPLRAVGLACPLCGLTRSFLALGRGRFSEAFLSNPLGPPLFLAFLLSLPFLTYSSLSGRRFRYSVPPAAGRLLPPVLLVALAGTWVYELARVVG